MRQKYKNLLIQQKFFICISYDTQKSACLSVTIAENRLILCIYVLLYVEEEVHDVSVLNDVLLALDSELSCGSAGSF